MSNEDSGPNTDRCKETGKNRSNDANNYNGMLLGRRIGIDNHGWCKIIIEVKK